MKDSPKVNSISRSPLFVWLSLAIVTLMLASCAAPTMRNQFVSYNDAYATALNKQMLLNLARLANGHPAYYLAIGAIDNRYTFSSQTGIGVSGGLQNQTTGTHNTPFVPTVTQFPMTVLQRLWQVTFGYNVNQTLLAQSNPEFQFIPINNQETAQQVLQPMDPIDFLSLYQQGYPIDQLMRMMIERIDVPPLPGGGQFVLINSPKSSDPFYYVRFLRTCAILRTLQMNGYLWLDAQPGLEPLGPVSFSSRQSGAGPQPQPMEKGNHEGATGQGANLNPAPTDFADAQNNNMLLIFTNLPTGTVGGNPAAPNSKFGWMAYRKSAVPKFFLNLEYEPTPAQQNEIEDLRRQEADVWATGGNSLAREEEMTNAGLQQVDAKIVSDLLARATPLIQFLESNTNEFPKFQDNYDAITNVVLALCMGVSIQTDLGQGDPKTTRLVLRSFNRTMESVATEQPGFETLQENHPDVFTNMIPEFERRPILQMLWTTNKPDSLQPPTESVNYADNFYQITDLKMSPTNSVSSWNRDTFRLLVGLDSLVTVDIAKFQRQVLELEQ